MKRKINNIPLATLNKCMYISKGIIYYKNSGIKTDNTPSKKKRKKIFGIF